MATKPYIVGIAGPTCSGKSLLAKRLAKHYTTRNAVVLPVDSYYRDLSFLEPDRRHHWNFDTPEAIDDELLVQHVSMIADGWEIERPIYQFPSHTRSKQTHTIAGTELLIVEGLFALYWGQIRSLMNLKVFIDASDSLCLSRRTDRDTVERGRSVRSIEDQYNNTVRPMYQKYVLPTRDKADVIVDGSTSIEQIKDILVRKIDSLAYLD